jgi:hypothetical protein
MGGAAPSSAVPLGSAVPMPLQCGGASAPGLGSCLRDALVVGKVAVLCCVMLLLQAADLAACLVPQAR